MALMEDVESIIATTPRSAISQTDEDSIFQPEVFRRIFHCDHPDEFRLPNHGSEETGYQVCGCCSPVQNTQPEQPFREEDLHPRSRTMRAARL